jgi:hypothetical protein
LQEIHYMHHGLLTAEIIPGRIRWLAIGTGCIAVVAGFVSIGSLFPIVPSVLILGALIQPRFLRLGRWLISVSAFLLSLAVLPLGVAILFKGVRTVRSYTELGVISIWAVSVLLVTWCDAELLIEARGKSRERRAID